MSDRIDFYEVRRGQENDWEHVCLCKDEDEAKYIAAVLANEEGKDFYVHHMELVASVDIEERDY